MTPFDSYRPLVFFAYNLIDNTQAAEDIVSEVMTKCYQNGIRGNIRAWLYRSVKNACLDYIKARKRIKTIPEHTEDTIDCLMIKAELLEWMRRSIELLPPQRKEVIKMYLDGLSIAEIGVKLGLAIGTVRAVKFQAIEQLRKGITN